MGVITWNIWFNYTRANMTILLFNTWEREQDVTEQFKWGLSLIKTCPGTLQSKNIIVQRIPSQRIPCSLYLLRNASQFTPSYSEKNPEKKNNIIDAIKKYIIKNKITVRSKTMVDLLRWDKCEFHHSSTYKKSPEIHAFSSVRPNSGKPRSKASIRVGLIIEPIQFNVF